MGWLALMLIVATCCSVATSVTNGKRGGYRSNWLLGLLMIGGAIALSVWVLAEKGL